LITSTVEPDGVLPVSIQRQLTQQQKNRAGAATVSFVDQRADDLSGTPDESVDVVISLQAAARMEEKGLDWRKSVQEAARVLKPGGRFLFVEQTTMSDGVKYIEYVGNLGAYDMDDSKSQGGDQTNAEGSTADDDEDDDDDDVYPTFECIGYDEVDFVITPHIAGVFVKAEDAGLTPEERAAKEAEAQKEKMAEMSLSAFERGNKKRRRKKKQNDVESSEV
jgi:SAM-dependent methyltransferase